MLKSAWLIACKDCRLVLARGGGLVQALLLGLLLIFVFSLARRANDLVEPTTAAAIFWLASVFCQVLAGNMLYSLEETCQARSGLLLMPAPVQAVWLGKGLASLVTLLTAQAVFLPGIVVFLGQRLGEDWLWGLAILGMTDLGLAAVGSLLGALSQGQSARESLLSIVLFPLLIPIMLAGVHLLAGILGEGLPADAGQWFRLGLAFDGLFLGAGLILFPFVFGDD